MVRKRSITFDSPQSRQDSFYRGLPRSASNISSNSPSQKRGHPRSKLTLPYFSFAPSVGRNSVTLWFSMLMVVIRRLDRGTVR
jgi:hypothetical protein